MGGFSFGFLSVSIRWPHHPVNRIDGGLTADAACGGCRPRANGSSPVSTTILEKSELNPDWGWVRISSFSLEYCGVIDKIMEAEADVDEKLKADDPMRWVGMMNTIKAQVEETIWNDIVLC